MISEIDAEKGIIRNGPRPEVIGLSGGRKQLYIRTHTPEILEYYAQHGLLYTMREFNLNYDTLQNILRNNIVLEVIKKPKKENDKLEIRLQMVETAVRDIKGKQQKLIKGFESFVPNMADNIAKKIIPGIARGIMESINDENPALSEDDKLRLE